MKKEDLLLTKQEQYFASSNGQGVKTNSLDRVGNDASLKTAKAIRNEINNLDYIDSQLTYSAHGHEIYRAQTTFAIRNLLDNLDSIIKELVIK
jgi:hypothetical protein